jgi:hypothetical protein
MCTRGRCDQTRQLGLWGLVRALTKPSATADTPANGITYAYYEIRLVRSLKEKTSTATVASHDLGYGANGERERVITRLGNATPSANVSDYST